jgi:glutamate-ammonia-ligase adenylyltransferase
LSDAWRLQQHLSQLLKVALTDSLDPAREPRPLRALLAKAGDTRDFAALRKRLERAREGARGASRAVLG